MGKNLVGCWWFRAGRETRPRVGSARARRGARRDARGRTLLLIGGVLLRHREGRVRSPCVRCARRGWRAGIARGDPNATEARKGGVWRSSTRGTTVAPENVTGGEAATFEGLLTHRGARCESPKTRARRAPPNRIRRKRTDRSHSVQVSRAAADDEAAAQYSLDSLARWMMSMSLLPSSPARVSSASPRRLSAARPAAGARARRARPPTRRDGTAPPPPPTTLADDETARTPPRVVILGGGHPGVRDRLLPLQARHPVHDRRARLRRRRRERQGRRVPRGRVGRPRHRAPAREERGAPRGARGGARARDVPQDPDALRRGRRRRRRRTPRTPRRRRLVARRRRPPRRAHGRHHRAGHADGAHDETPRGGSEDGGRRDHLTARRNRSRARTRRRFGFGRREGSASGASSAWS